MITSIFGFQRRDQRIQRVLNVGTLRFDAFAQLIGQINVKTDSSLFEFLDSNGGIR